MSFSTEDKRVAEVDLSTFRSIDAMLRVLPPLSDIMEVLRLAARDMNLKTVDHAPERGDLMLIGRGMTCVIKKEQRPQMTMVSHNSYLVKMTWDDHTGSWRFSVLDGQEFQAPVSRQWLLLPTPEYSEGLRNRVTFLYETMCNMFACVPPYS